MNLSKFLHSVESEAEPHKSLSIEVQAMWWQKKGNWQKAHSLAQKAKSKDGDWIHAYLHRVEGDLGNASYWYARAGKPVSRDALSTEWVEITTRLLHS